MSQRHKIRPTSLRTSHLTGMASFSAIFSRVLQPILQMPTTAILTVSILPGCAEPISPPTPAITTEMHENFEHQHSHQHGKHHDHEHEHEDGFEGSHTHDHSHGHRHGSPLHGGRVISIGHTHHKGGESHFHAEVMPVVDNSISFHILTENELGKSVDHPIKATEIAGLIGAQGNESLGQEIVFRADSDGGKASRFIGTIPQQLINGAAYSVVIPKVVLSGQRKNFSFTTERSVQAADPKVVRESENVPGQDGGEKENGNLTSDSSNTAAEESSRD